MKVAVVPIIVGATGNISIIPSVSERKGNLNTNRNHRNNETNENRIQWNLILTD